MASLRDRDTYSHLWRNPMISRKEYRLDHVVFDFLFLLRSIGFERVDCPSKSDGNMSATCSEGSHFICYNPLATCQLLMNSIRFVFFCTNIADGNQYERWRIDIQVTPHRWSTAVTKHLDVPAGIPASWFTITTSPCCCCWCWRLYNTQGWHYGFNMFSTNFPSPKRLLMTMTFR